MYLNEQLHQNILAVSPAPIWQVTRSLPLGRDRPILTSGSTVVNLRRGTPTQLPLPSNGTRCTSWNNGLRCKHLGLSRTADEWGVAWFARAKSLGAARKKKKKKLNKTIEYYCLICTVHVRMQCWVRNKLQLYNLRFCKLHTKGIRLLNDVELYWCSLTYA